MSHYTGGTIEIVYPHHNPNEGRDIWNRNFQYVEDAIHFSISGSTTAHTQVNGSSNITVLNSGATVPLIYTIYLNDDVTLNSIFSNSISADTFYIGSGATNPTFMYDLYADFPFPGDEDYIYGARDTNNLYRWDSTTTQYFAFNDININNPSANSESQTFYVRLATNGALNSCTYNNSLSGVGATLTATANGVLAQASSPGLIDTKVAAVSDLILIKNQSSSLQNGIYEVTQIGDGSNPFILTRIDGYNQTDEVYPSIVFVSDGSANINRYFSQSTANPVIGTSNIVYQVATVTQAVSPVIFVDSVTISALPTSVYTNGTVYPSTLPGYGATLSATTAGAIGVINGVTMTSGMRLLVKSQSNQAHNGVYTVTNPGSATQKWVLTRFVSDSSMFYKSREYVVTHPNSLAYGDRYSVNSPLSMPNSAYGTTAIIYIKNNESNLYDLWSASTGTNSIIANNGTGNLASGNFSIAGGYSSLASGNYSLVVGGGYNSATTIYSSVVGGNRNLSSGNASFIGGGIQNSATTNFSSIVGGSQNSTSYFSFIGGGRSNSTISSYSSIVGGRLNLASGIYSHIGGGYRNSATTYSSVVSGGKKNISSGYYSFIGGGYGNILNSNYSTLAGGNYNLILGSVSFVGGGEQNSATTAFSTIVGGKKNIASGNYSFIGGGEQNSATTVSSTISGGRQNLALGNYSSIAGGIQNSASGIFSSVAGGNQNSASDNASFVGGGKFNINSGYESSILGGAANQITSQRAFIGGGKQNLVSGNYSSIINGRLNLVTGNRAFVGSGYKNSATTTYSAVVGGIYNISSGNKTFIGNGYRNEAYGYMSSVVGGNRNISLGAYSFIGGGFVNSAATDFSIVVGGSQNLSSGNSSFIGGGGQNISSGAQSFVGGGFINKASGDRSSVVGGRQNSATTEYSAIVGGSGNTVSGARSVVLGGQSIIGSANDTVYVPRLVGTRTDEAALNLPVFDVSFTSTTQGDIWITTGATSTFINVYVGGVVKSVELS